MKKRCEKNLKTWHYYEDTVFCSESHMIMLITESCPTAELYCNSYTVDHLCVVMGKSTKGFLELFHQLFPVGMDKK